MPEIAQRAFAAGEISPSMAGRADMVPYGTGLQTARNVIGKIEGGIMNRPGSQFIRAAKVLGAKGHKFSFNESESYHLEFGYDAAHVAGDGSADASGYIRFTYRLATLVLPAGTSTGVTAWANAAVYVIGNLVSKGTRHYYCKVAHTAATGVNDPDIAGGVAYWYLLSVNPDVTNGSIFEVPTPYLAADIEFIYPTQSADVMVLTCRRPGTLATASDASYAPRLLTRHTHIWWDLLPPPFKPEINGPALGTVTLVGATPGTGYFHRYKVTAIAKDGGEESLPGYAPTPIAGTVTAAGTADVQITSAAHGLTSGDEIIIVTFTSTTVLDKIMESALLRMVFKVTVISANIFSLNDTAGLTFNSGQAVTWNYTVLEDEGYDPSTVQMSTAIYRKVTWTLQADAISYVVYKEDVDGTGSYGFLGTSTTGVFKDVGLPPDMSESPPQATPKFLLDGNHPAVGSFFDQRLVLANSELKPQTIYLSRTGDLFNFTIRSPIQDDDAITAPLVQRHVTQIKHVVELGEGALVLTSESEGLLLGDGDAVVSPTSIRHKPQGYHGASKVLPLEIADRILYALARGNKIREIQRGQFGGYEEGLDPALFSQHFFGSACGCSIITMDYAERPDNVVWVVRSDGVMLAMVYLPNQNVRCWTWNETHGMLPHYYKDVRVVPEGSTDTPYVIVQRVMDGVTGHAAQGTSAAGALGDPIEYIEAIVPRCPGCDE